MSAASSSMIVTDKILVEWCYQPIKLRDKAANQAIHVGLLYGLREEPMWSIESLFIISDWTYLTAVLQREMVRRRRSLSLLLYVLGQILFIVSPSAVSSPEDKIIRIGYLSTFLSNAGAINVAIDRAQSEGLFLEYNFRYICYHNSVNEDAMSK